LHSSPPFFVRACIPRLRTYSGAVPTFSQSINYMLCFKPNASPGSPPRGINLHMSVSNKNEKLAAKNVKERIGAPFWGKKTRWDACSFSRWRLRLVDLHSINTPAEIRSRPFSRLLAEVAEVVSLGATDLRWIAVAQLADRHRV